MNLRGLILWVLTDLNFLFGHCGYIKNYNIKWYSFFKKKKKPAENPVLYSGAYWNTVELTVFFRTDGSFVVHDVPSGSYVVEVISPAHKFEPVRVDITSKGKMRWAFPDLPLYWWITCAWQHSTRTHGNSAVVLILHLRLYVSVSFNITYRSKFLKFRSLDMFLPLVFMAWNKKK